MYVVKKSEHNPIFSHKKENFFEAYAAFNMSTIKVDKNVYGIYRAESSLDRTRKPERVSSIGIAKSKDGVNFEERRLFIEANQEWDRCGCEDPRVTFFEGSYYIFYTAISDYPFGADNIKVGVATSKDLKEINGKHLVTPFNAKAMALFPERVNGKVTVVLSVNTDRDNMQMAIAQVDEIEQLWEQKFWEEWYKDLDKHSLKISRSKNDYYEGGAVPVLTKDGWLFVHSYIQNYKGGGEKIFGIEALVLDKDSPLKIIGRTAGPIIVPTEDYELIGPVENICFPSGVILEADKLSIYYGAADARTCVASLSLSDLMGTIMYSSKSKYSFERASLEPIISPLDSAGHEWESLATFNPGAIRIKDKTFILYRAMSKDNTSTIGLAISADGVNIDERLPEPIYVPSKDFENKKVPNGNSGCEDPRVLAIGEDIYMFYTAYNGIDKPMVAATKISKQDFINKKWNWQEPHLISQDNFDDKDTCIFPEKIKDKYFVIHRIGEDICGDFIDTLDIATERLDKCFAILAPRPNSWDSLKVGIACPPLKTEQGWLVLYHGISRSSHTYRVGAVLLDLKDPSYVLARSADPIFEPELKWEKEGIVNNVVFPCGMCEIGKYLYIYYGGADKVVGVARMELDIILKALRVA